MTRVFGRLTGPTLLLSLLGVATPHLAHPDDGTQSQTQNPRGDREQDGQHDFDFEIGTWKTHLKVLLHPMTDAATWVEFDGTSTVRKIWGGKANMVELNVDGPSGHIEGLSLRLYNPASHQWSLNYANSKVGTMDAPTVGAFRSGRGEFYDMEAINGRMTLIRNIWSDITPTSCRFEQAFSVDGGKTWQTNWIATDTRVAETTRDE